jgi:hypothetical protein
VGQAVAAVEEINGVFAVAARGSGGAPAVQARLALAMALEGLQASHPSLVLINAASPASAIFPSKIGAKHAGWQRAVANIRYSSSTFEKDRAKLAIASIMPPNFPTTQNCRVPAPVPGLQSPQLAP